jgi:hypothetical protein
MAGVLTAVGQEKMPVREGVREKTCLGIVTAVHCLDLLDNIVCHKDREIVLYGRSIVARLTTAVNSVTEQLNKRTPVKVKSDLSTDGDRERVKSSSVERRKGEEGV